GVGEKGGGRHGEGVGGQQGGGQGVPPEAGGGGHAVLGAQGEEDAGQGGHGEGAHHHGQGDQEDPEPGGLHVLEHGALPPHVHPHQKQKQVEAEVDDRPAVGGDRVGEDKVSAQHAQDHGGHDQDSEAVVHVGLLVAGLGLLRLGLLGGAAKGVHFQDVLPKGVDRQHAADHGGDGDGEGVQ